MRILVLVNPVAGNGKTRRLMPKIKNRLSKTPHEFSWIVTQSPDEMRSHIQNAAGRGIEAVLLVGGDGTIHEALPSLSEGSPPMGVIPCGRGNDFARNVGIPLNLGMSCSFQEHPVIRMIDLPKVNGRPFGSIASIGFDSLVSRFAHEKKGFFGGTLGYIVCVFRALSEFEPIGVETDVDGTFWSGRAMMVAISNGRFYGGGMKIAPDAEIDDGLFSICIVKEIPKRVLLCQFPKVFRGEHIAHPAVVMTMGKKVNVASDREGEIFADGECVGRTPALFTIERKKIRVILPIEERG